MEFICVDQYFDQINKSKYNQIYIQTKKIHKSCIQLIKIIIKAHLHINSHQSHHLINLLTGGTDTYMISKSTDKFTQQINNTKDSLIHHCQNNLTNQMEVNKKIHQFMALMSRTIKALRDQVAILKKENQQLKNQNHGKNNSYVKPNHFNTFMKKSITDHQERDQLLASSKKVSFEKEFAKKMTALTQPMQQPIVIIEDKANLRTEKSKKLGRPRMIDTVGVSQEYIKQFTQKTDMKCKLTQQTSMIKHFAISVLQKRLQYDPKSQDKIVSKKMLAALYIKWNEQNNRQMQYNPPKFIQKTLTTFVRRIFLGVKHNYQYFIGLTFKPEYFTPQPQKQIRKQSKMQNQDQDIKDEAVNLDEIDINMDEFSESDEMSSENQLQILEK